MNLQGATVAVTGATGFLGGYIVDVLLRRGAHVVGVVRNPERVPALAQRGVELRRADLVEPEALRAGFRGADAVVSNAALFSLRNRDWDEHQRTNVRGTENVFGAIAAAGVRRVVHVSSVAVYAGRTQPKPAEDHPQYGAESRRSWLSAYPISKALSEQRAWRLADELGLALTTVRPCAIYGAFDPNFTPIFKALVGFPITVLPAFLRIPFVYAGDVAEAIALALERPIAVGRAYNTTGDDRTFQEFAAAWEEAGGKSAYVKIPLPVPIDRTFDNARAERELGWRNRSFADGLRETLALEAAGRFGSS